MRNRICKICGKEFEPRHPNSKYCCELCAAMGRKKKLKAWHENNQGYITIHMREYRRTKKMQLEAQ